MAPPPMLAYKNFTSSSLSINYTNLAWTCTNRKNEQTKKVALCRDQQ
ncbi:hypothetical protein THTE_1915 [Thermogutta terrifontis]|uniref:Uncharacterized protein n=1 Tax=Thermogutta terrifontis TaxID=1331910 RepID=A0A286REZ9_9BACT|nr:hypothetical protein THTE_1915 [Thermogutta terrifontis]